MTVETNENQTLVLEVCNPTREESLACLKSCLPTIDGSAVSLLTIRGFGVPGQVTKVEFNNGTKLNLNGESVDGSLRLYFVPKADPQTNCDTVITVKRTWRFAEGAKVRQIAGSNSERIGYPVELRLSARFVSARGVAFYYAWFSIINSFQLVSVEDIERDYNIVT